MTQVQVGNFELGAGACFVIAEAGVNHNGDPSLAHLLVEAAAKAGAHAVKFQTFDPEQLAARDTPKAAYQRERTGDGDSQLEMLRKLSLPKSAFGELAYHAREVGIEFLSSPFDHGSVDVLAEIGVSAFKIGSGELTNHRLLRHVAELGKPVLLSTGMANLQEVREAVDVIREAGDPPLALFHCVSAYPTAPAWCNLRAMQTLRATFDVPVGWSDHSTDAAISLAAVALGAELLEKHLTLDRTLRGPDHAASADPQQFAELTAGVNAVLAALGDGDKKPVEAELEVAAVARKSLHSARDLAPGERISQEDLVALRPGTGISPAREDDVVGRVTARAVAAGDMLLPDALR